MYPHAKQNSFGNYYYLYFTTVFPFFTSHPFTAAEWHDQNFNAYESSSDSEDKSNIDKFFNDSNSAESSMSFYVQVQSGTTRKIYRQLEANGFEPIKIFSFLEGPYGSYESSTFDDYDFVILLTGGIGNTVVLNYVSHFVQYKSKKCLPNNSVKLSIIHSDRFNSRLGVLKSRIDSILPKSMESDVEVDLHHTLNAGRLDISQYLTNKVKSFETNYPRGTRRIAVVCCGSPKFNDVCRRTCVDMQTRIHHGTMVSYITDPFEW